MKDEIFYVIYLHNYMIFHLFISNINKYLQTVHPSRFTAVYLLNTNNNSLSCKKKSRLKVDFKLNKKIDFHVFKTSQGLIRINRYHFRSDCMNFDRDYDLESSEPCVGR